MKGALPAQKKKTSNIRIFSTGRFLRIFKNRYFRDFVLENSTTCLLNMLIPIKFT